jgi:hypothetical protein
MARTFSQTMAEDAVVSRQFRRSVSAHSADMQDQVSKCRRPAGSFLSAGASWPRWMKSSREIARSWGAGCRKSELHAIK